MKVLLVKDIERLGWLGDVVEVKTGYARNYLLPHRMAVAVTDANIRAIADDKTKAAESRLADQARIATAATAVEGAEAVVAAKANEQGHLFGSVTAREIAANLREQGFEIADGVVQLPEHIKEVGTHEVALKVAAELFAKISVVVVSQDEEIESTATESEE